MKNIRSVFWILVSAVLILPTSLTWCAAQDYLYDDTPMSTRTSQSLEGEFADDDSEYALGRGDRIVILVRNQPDFSGEFIIGPGGEIQFPFLEDIRAAGLTKLELKTQLVELLEKFIKFPEIHVSVKEYRSKFIYILGEVGRPGKYNIAGDTIKLRDAVIEAGLPTRDAALARVYVIKPDDARPLSMRVNLKKILYKGVLKENVDLIPGDLVVVSTMHWSKFSRFMAQLLDPLVRIAILDNLIDRN